MQQDKLLQDRILNTAGQVQKMTNENQLSYAIIFMKTAPCLRYSSFYIIENRRFPGIPQKE
jgi:hypothetical protein